MMVLKSSSPGSPRRPVRAGHLHQGEVGGQDVARLQVSHQLRRLRPHRLKGRHGRD